MTDLQPSSDAEMLAELTPCLALVAPVGMDIDAQDTWLEAAMKALAGIPLGLLRRGAAAAMRKADHPAKVVPAILAEVQEAWEWRRKAVKPGDAPPALPAPDEHRITPEEAAEICKRYGVGRFAAPPEVEA